MVPRLRGRAAERRSITARLARGRATTTACWPPSVATASRAEGEACARRGPYSVHARATYRVSGRRSLSRAPVLAGVLGVTLAPRPAAAGSGWQADTDGLRLGVHERGPGPGGPPPCPTSPSPTWPRHSNASARSAARSSTPAIGGPKAWSVRASLLYETCGQSGADPTDTEPKVSGSDAEGRVQESPATQVRLANRLGSSGLQQLSELREGYVVWDETLAATGKAFLRRVANDVPGVGNGLDEAPTAALLARQLDGDR